MTTVEVDARWVMAYAAGLGESDPRYFTASPLVHPLFPVCVEWVSVSRQTVSSGGVGVHYAHELVLHRPLTTPMTVTTSSSIGPSAAHRAGTLVTTSIDAVAGGVPQWTTRMTSLFLSSPPPAVSAASPPPLLKNPVSCIDVPVAAGAAHVYTECARIWNPIHTDPAVAAQAGLPGPILHGTATLALAVSRVLSVAEWSPASVARIEATFGAMVPMPTILTVRVGAADADVVEFDVLTAEGRPAVRGGRITRRR